MSDLFLAGQWIPPHVLSDIKMNLFFPSPSDADAFVEEVQFIEMTDDKERNALVAKYRAEGAADIKGTDTHV